MSSAADLRPWAVAAVVAAVVAATMGDYGYTWDEPVYLNAGARYWTWMRDLGPVDATWSYNSEHPPLAKVAGGASAWLLDDVLGVTGRQAGYRASNLAFVFVLAALIYKSALHLTGLHGAGILAVAAVFTMPRLFFHAHIGALDFAMATLWFATIYAFWRDQVHDRPPLRTAALFGLALLTKVNAVLLAVPLIVIWMVWEVPALRSRPTRRHRTIAASGSQHLLVIGGGGLAMLIIFWPWLWESPLDRLVDYLGFFQDHDETPTRFLGATSATTPATYSLVLTVLTIPLLTLAAALVATGRGLRSPSRWRYLAVFGTGAIVPVAALALPGAARFDGVRLFLPAFPFIGLAAGVGLVVAGQYARARWPLRRSGTLMAGAVAVGLLFLPTVRHYGHETAYYNALAAGPADPRCNMEVQYWGDAYIDLLPVFARYPGANIGMLGAPLTAAHQYREDGMLDPSTRFVARRESLPDADLLVVVNRGGVIDSHHARYTELIRDRALLETATSGSLPIAWAFGTPGSGLTETPPWTEGCRAAGSSK